MFLPFLVSEGDGCLPPVLSINQNVCSGCEPAFYLWFDGLLFHPNAEALSVYESVI